MILGWSLVTEAMVESFSTEETALPASNLGTMQPTEAWRTTDATSNVTIDLGSALEVKAAGMLYGLVGLAASIQYRSATTKANLTAAPSYNTGVVGHDLAGSTTAWNWQHFVDWDSSGHTQQWHRFDMTGTFTNAYYQAGRALLMAPFEPVLNAQFGDIELGWLTEEFELRAYGPRYPRDFPRWRYVDFSIHSASKAEVYASAFDIDQRRGLSNDVFVWLDPTETAYPHHTMFHGTITDMGGIEYVAGTATADAGFWRKRWRIEELL